MASVSSVTVGHCTNANVTRRWLPIYRDMAVVSWPAFVMLERVRRRHSNDEVVVSLPFGGQAITVTWSVSDLDGCAHFIRSLSQ